MRLYFLLSALILIHMRVFWRHWLLLLGCGLRLINTGFYHIYMVISDVIDRIVKKIE